jgi:hypothetical protein
LRIRRKRRRRKRRRTTRRWRRRRRTRRRRTRRRTRRRRTRRRSRRRRRRPRIDLICSRILTSGRFQTQAMTASLRHQLKCKTIPQLPLLRSSGD